MMTYNIDSLDLTILLLINIPYYVNRLWFLNILCVKDKTIIKINML